MPTVMTHAVAGLGVAAVCAPHPMPWPYYLLAGGLAVLPDLDVLSFALGIPYGSRFGHRGFSHSLVLALLVGLAAGWLTSEWFAVNGWVLGGIYFAAMASHSLLDAVTNGGMGVALLAPFDDTRYFFRWRPVQVSPIGRGFFSRWGLRAFWSEVRWIWGPVAGAVTLVWACRGVALS